MMLQEFKAWFEGFCENLDGRPNDKQWKRIKARVKDIDGCSVTPVIIDRWRDRYVPEWPRPYPVWCGGSTGSQLPKKDTTVWLSSVGDAGNSRVNDFTDPVRAAEETLVSMNTMLADMGKEEARTLA